MVYISLLMQEAKVLERLILVSNNDCEFERVEGLRLENWIELK